MVAAFKNQNALSVNLWHEAYSPDKRKELDQIYPARQRQDTEPIGDFDIKYELVANGSHQGEITTLSTCLQRPILLTSSVQDQTIRVWDYTTNKCVLQKSFVILDSSTGKIA
jgi:WD40 repeat protein